MSGTRLEFDNQRGERLVGILHGDPALGAVISCHGMLSTKDGDKHRLLADELTRKNVATLRFDFAGRGESQGSLFDLSFTREAEDLDAAVELLWRRGARKIALFGSSMGGSVAYLAAARDERIVAVATLAAVGHTEAVVERHPDEVHAWETRGYIETLEGRIGRAFLDDSLAHDVVQAVRILRVPVFVAHGEEDEVVPVSDAHDIATAARHATLELVPGADHRFTNLQHLRPTMRHIADFLAAALISP